ncbi:NAD-dependent epimerase/dehydratase family protein [Candidatus Puniceispirillum sp.]|nr:NAD-dependent epimerase/dehydratase family protein [Candidatus Puniceispirillum sp.]
MRVLLTGANGFIGKNLAMQLWAQKDVDVLTFGRDQNVNELTEMLERADWVIHLAGVNRPIDPNEFVAGNHQFTEQLCDAIRDTGRIVPVIFSSSIKAEQDNPYGKSKKAAEETLLQFQRETANPVFIYRLPNVFGKWARPDYNSVVATFCHRILNNLAVDVHDPLASIRLVYVDDVVNSFILLLNDTDMSGGFVEINPEYQVTVGGLLQHLREFKKTRDLLTIERVGSGLKRALYSTYVSYMETDCFAYSVPRHADARGVFVEMLKTTDSGQFSYFTANPGVKRGGHYHHSKTEKFLVIKGRAQFRFRHILTNELHELFVSGEKSEIVETVPGWTHDIINIGDDELICMLWANEVFNREKPDTFFDSQDNDGQ